MVEIMRRFAGLFLAAALLFTGCGDDDDSDTAANAQDTKADDATSDEDEAPDGGGSPDDLVFEASDSSFTLDGNEFEVQGILRCIPFSTDDEPLDGELDIQALDEDGTVLFLEYSPGDEDQRQAMEDQGAPPELLDQFGPRTFVSFQSGATQELYGVQYIDGDTEFDSSEVTDDRMTGAATITDDETGQVVDVTWDVEIPPETKDCSL